MYNISLSKEIVSLESTDIGPLCGQDDTVQRWVHRHQCHKASYEAICKYNAKFGRSTPEMKKKCRTSWSSYHCECYTRHKRLHWRLKSWMPQSLRYCGTCEMFTKRKKQHNGRCKLPFEVAERMLMTEGYHGRPKARRFQGHYWTHTSRGGSFGRKIWKKWFNNNAMNHLEARLRYDGENQRKGSERYSLRKLEPRNVNSRVARGQPSYF
jgi:hypothetical protein